MGHECLTHITLHGPWKVSDVGDTLHISQTDRTGNHGAAARVLGLSATVLQFHTSTEYLWETREESRARSAAHLKTYRTQAKA